jgi:dipeptidase E
VCFVGTASGDDASYVEKFHSAFRGRADTTVLALFNSEPEGAIPVDQLERVLEHHVVYVGGGSTANLLAVWRLHGLVTVLEEAAARGTVLAGISAGMNCWFEGSSTDSLGPLAPLTDGLGFLPGSACPHYFAEADRRAAYLGMVASGELSDGYAVDDGVALLWQDGELVEAVSERPDGQAFRVARNDRTAVETPLNVRFLGDPEPETSSPNSFPGGRSTAGAAFPSSALLATADGARA